jgi:hypothetical protein
MGLERRKMIFRHNRDAGPRLRYQKAQAEVSSKARIIRDALKQEK